MGIEIVKFRKFEKNTLKGFLTILMNNIGLEIRDCTFHRKDDKKWIGLPAKPYTDQDGNEKYSYIVKFADKDRYYQFQDAVLKELDKYLSKESAYTPEQDIPF